MAAPHVPAPRSTPEENHLVIVLSLATVLGMAVAIGIYMGWQHGVIPPALNGPASMVALFFCPPYILSIIVGPTAEAELMDIVVAGSIVIANAFLYAGVAAGGYYLVTMAFKPKR